MGSNPRRPLHHSLPPTRPSEVSQPGATEAQIRIEALQVAMRLPDAHSTSAVLENAKSIRDWIQAGRA